MFLEILTHSFCSGAQAKEVKTKLVNASTAPAAESNHTNGEVASTPVKKIIDINQPQVCKNKGCGKTFKEKDNHETACSYHPGPAVFHDRMRGVCTYTIYSSHKILI